MHPYAIDSDERKTILLLIAAASVILAWSIHSILGAMQLVLPWWFDAPSVMGLYEVLYGIFDRWLWQKPIFRKVGLVKTPDFNGNWVGYICSSFDEYKTKFNASIKVLQSWTRIKIILRTENSESHSLTATVITENPVAPVLSYEYLNEPKANVERTMHTHRGTARLNLTSNGKVLDGDYYTGRDRQEFGILYFERSQSK